MVSRKSPLPTEGKCHQQRSQPLPIACWLPWLAEISFQSVRRGCIYFAINKEQRKWQGLESGACGLLLGPRIPTLSVVLLTPGPGAWEGCQSPYGTLCLFLAKSPAVGLLSSGVMSTGAPLLTEGAVGRPMDRGILAVQVSENSSYWFFVMPSSKWEACR